MNDIDIGLTKETDQRYCDDKLTIRSYNGFYCTSMATSKDDDGAYIVVLRFWREPDENKAKEKEYEINR